MPIHRTVAQVALDAALAPMPDAARSAGSRRLLLGIAASGFALAAGGLQLPERLVGETEAADHPVRRVQHRAEKRRQRQRHRLKQKRTQQRRQPGHANAPGVGTKVLQITLNNSFMTEYIGFWTGTNGWGFDPGNDALRIVQHQSYGPYSTADRRAGFYFYQQGEARPFIWVEIQNNGAANTTIQSGGGMTTSGYQGGTTIVNHFPLGQGDSIVKNLDLTAKCKVTVSRDNDTRDAMVFTVTVAFG